MHAQREIAAHDTRESSAFRPDGVVKTRVDTGWKLLDGWMDAKRDLACKLQRKVSAAGWLMACASARSKGVRVCPRVQTKLPEAVKCQMSIHAWPSLKMRQLEQRHFCHPTLNKSNLGHVWMSADLF